MAVMESRDLVSVSKAAGLKTLNIANKWLNKTYFLTSFLFVVFASKKQPIFEKNTFEKNSTKNIQLQIHLKKIQLRSDDDIFFKNFGKIHKFCSLESWSRNSSLESRSRNFWWSPGLGLEVLTKFRSRSRRLRSRLHHCTMGSLWLGAIAVNRQVLRPCQRDSDKDSRHVSSTRFGHG